MSHGALLDVFHGQVQSYTNLLGSAACHPGGVLYLTADKIRL